MDRGLEDKEALRRAYVDEGLSLAAIGRMVGCSEGTVRRALVAAGVEIRRAGPRRATAPAAPGPLADRAYLEDAYVAHGRSARSIAAEVGCTKDAVLLALRAHGIPVRPRRPPARAADQERLDEPERHDEPEGHDASGRLAPIQEPRAEGATAQAVAAGGGADVADHEVAARSSAPPVRTEARPDHPPLESAIADAAEAIGDLDAHDDDGRAPARPGGPKSRRVLAGSVPVGAREVDPAQIENRTFPIVRRGYDRDEVDAFVRTMAREHRQLVERTRQALEAARQAAARQAAAEQAAAEQRTAAPAPDQLFGELGTRVTAVLSSATEVAEGIKAAAIEEAEAIRQQAYEDTDEMRREVADKLAEADRLVAEAEQEAERVLATARTEGARVVTGARDRAEQISHDAEERAAALERTVRANVEAILAEARREYEHLRTAQQQCIDRLASVEFLAKHARDGLSDAFTSTFDERLEATR